MPYANASARKSGPMGTTVNERRIASLNFVSTGLSRVFSRNSSSREVTKLAVPDAGSRRQSSASRREARSKAPRAIRPSTSARKFDGLCSSAFGSGGELDIESDIDQILNQRSRYSISRRFLV